MWSQKLAYGRVLQILNPTYERKLLNYSNLTKILKIHITLSTKIVKLKEIFVIINNEVQEQDYIPEERMYNLFYSTSILYYKIIVIQRGNEYAGKKISKGREKIL